MSDHAPVSPLPTFEEAYDKFWRYVTPSHLEFIRGRLSEACYLAQERCELDWENLGDKTPEKIHRGNDFAHERNKLIIRLLNEMSDQFEDVTTEIRLPDAGPRTYLAIYIGRVLLTTKSKGRGRVLPYKSNYIKDFARMNTYIPQSPIPGMMEHLGLKSLQEDHAKEKPFDLYGMICHESNIKDLLTDAWIKFPDYNYKLSIGDGINLWSYVSTKMGGNTASKSNVGMPVDVEKKGVRPKKIQEEEPGADNGSVEGMGG